ncbi:LOW QUALITY PROTEIN: aminomethyltransferase, mitochondrial [Bemisia tabaci]
MTNPSLSSMLFRTSSQLKCIPNRTLFGGRIANPSGVSASRAFAAEAHSKQDDKPARTSLYDLHVQNSGKMVDFAGYLLPVQYGNVSITESHLHTRSQCSIFDVSHMLQTEITGPDAFDLLESVCVTDVQGLGLHKSALSVFTNSEGGIEDDFVVTKSGEQSLYVVSNAARKRVVADLLLTAADKFKSSGKTAQVTFRDPEERALLAVQGPRAAQILQPLVDMDLSSFYFMSSAAVALKDAPDSRITRCGYTGEDGFEVAIDARKAPDFVQGLLQKHPDLVKLAGLGARDSLRIEAGLCLYGNEIDSTTTPPEAGLTWTIGKKRRERADFPGASKILEQIKEGGAYKQRVGLVQEGKGLCPRNGAEILTLDIAPHYYPVGKVTSGCPSPTLKTNIAMGTLPRSLAKPGNVVFIANKNNLTKLTVTKMPFVPAKYFTKPKKK